jgi:cysteine desulfurase/selenocysteine lyase
MTTPGDAARRDFEALDRQVHGRDLVYLDTAATAHKPRVVIDRLDRFYRSEYATVRRGVYLTCQEATRMYEGVRERVRRFLGAATASEVVFVRGTTEALNLLASSLGAWRLGPGDEVLVTEMEHHANIVPWHMACGRAGATLRAAPVDDLGRLDLDAMAAMITPRTRIVAVTHVSNVLGTENPIAEISRLAHEVGALVVVDGAQSAPHLDLDMPSLGCDFFVCSGHKLYGPSGVGVLWGRYGLLAEMPPWQGGGVLIEYVGFDRVTFTEPPWRFEAGTPPIASVIGLEPALDYLDAIGKPAIRAWEHHLLERAESRLLELGGVTILGRAPGKASLTSFVLDGLAPIDVGMILDREGIAVRVGQHCAQPLLRRFGVQTTLRASFGLYSTESDVDRLIDGLIEARELLR